MDNNFGIEPRSDQSAYGASIRDILIVDDDGEVSRAIAQMVSHLGYGSFICSTAEEALEFLSTHKVDLLLVDYRMPELTGLDLITILKEEDKLVPAVMMTGFAETEERIIAERCCPLAILRKPVTMTALTAVIEDAMRTAARAV